MRFCFKETLLFFHQFPKPNFLVIVLNTQSYFIALSKALSTCPYPCLIGLQIDQVLSLLNIIQDTNLVTYGCIICC